MGRIIQKMNCFHPFDPGIPVNMLGSLNQVITVCAVLSNFQEPFMKRISKIDSDIPESA